MATWEFLDNANAYPATMSMGNAYARLISGALKNCNGVRGFSPLRYNSVSLVNFNNKNAAPFNFATRTFSGATFNGYAFNIKGAFAGAFAYAENNYLPIGNTNPNNDWNTAFVDVLEPVIYFTVQTVKDYVENTRKNTVKVCEALFISGEHGGRFLNFGGASMGYNKGTYLGYIGKCDWNKYGDSDGIAGSIEDIEFDFTNDYDNYYLITDYKFYYKPSNAPITRTEAFYHPVIYYVGNSFTGLVSAVNANNYNNPTLTIGSDVVAYMALSGTSINQIPETMYSAATRQQDAYARVIGNGNFIPTGVISGGITNLDNATNIIKQWPVNGVNSRNAGALDLSACPYEPSATNHKALIACAEGTFNYVNSTAFIYNGQKYASAPTNNNQQPAVLLAFRSIGDIVSYFNDWGFKATNSQDEAIYGQYDDIEDGDPLPSPSGGDSGYINPSFPDRENENITSIPSDDRDLIDDFNSVVPTTSPINLLNNYALNFSGVKSLFNWLCTKSYIDNISELFGDKLSAIYGLLQYPFDIVNHDPAHCSYQDELTIVNVSNTTPCYALANGYNTIVKGGYINYTARYGDFRDWTNCTYSLYVPYGGIVDVPASAVVNRKLTLDYCVDLLTGKATAIIKSYDNSENLGALIKTVPCQIGLSIPIQSSSYGQQAINNTLSSISMLGNFIAGTAGAIMSANPLAMLGTLNGVAQQGAQMAFNQRTQYSANGGVSPSTGLSLPQTPYLCITRARPVKPSNFANINGLPSNTYYTLSSVATPGNLVKMQNVIVSAEGAIDSELQQISEMLESGIYT